MILILSESATDAHIIPVAAELQRRGRPVCLFNPGDYPTAATITVDASPAGPATFLTWEGRTLDLRTVTSIWLRRPGDVRLADGLLPHEATWVRGECVELLRSLWANLDALWVSEPHHIRQANLKLRQLRLAAGLGFRVPPYTVTNDPRRAAEFLAAHPAGVIVKVLTEPALSSSDAVATIYTHLVTKADETHLDSVRHGPTFLQQFVPKQLDLRVTVIGDRVFAAGIESTREARARIDFRRAEILDLPHRPVTLPPAVEAACLALTRQLELRFGAIDLLLTPEGEYVFLEINPNGQWLWIEMTTGLPLASAMADLLARGRE